MANKPKLSNELAGLGKDLADVLKQMKRSKEFKTFERDLVRGVKSITKSLKTSLKATSQSKSAGRLKKRFKRVVKAGKKQGKVELQKAQRAAVTGIKKSRSQLRSVVKKIKSRDL